MDNPSPQRNKRLTFLVMGLIDAILGGTLLLVWFGIPPIDLSGLGIPRWIVGVVGAVWFFPGLAIFAYQFTRLNQDS